MYRLFFRGIHNLLDTARELLLQILCIITIRIDLYFRNIDRIIDDLAGFQIFIRPYFNNTISLFAKLSVFFLLIRTERLIKHLQFQCLLYIGAVTKPQDQLITCLDTLVRHTGLMIQICQFKCPFLCIFLLLQFTQDSNLFRNRFAFCTAQMIAQDVFECIVRRNLNKFIIILLCLVKLLGLNCNLSQSINNLLSNRRSVICHEKQFFTILITPVLLVDLPDQHQRIHIAHLSPIDPISDLRRCRIVFLSGERLYLI